MRKPKLSRDEAQQIIDHHKKHYGKSNTLPHHEEYPELFYSDDKVFFFGIEGYYLDTVGKRGKNDLGKWDDAIGYLSPSRYDVFIGNVDPSRVWKWKKDRKGKTYLKNLADLNTGIYRFYRGRHYGLSKKGYSAFRAFPERVKWPCTRAGKSALCQLINLHWGESWNTYSEGCQTLVKRHFRQSFQPDSYSEIDKHGGLVLGNKRKDGTRFRSTTVPYILTRNKYVDGIQRLVDWNDKIIF